MTALLIAGVPAFACAIGAWLLGRSATGGFPRFTTLTLAPVVGVAVVTPLLLVAASIGHFDVRAMGGLGWLAAVAVLLAWRPSLRRMRVTIAEAVVLAAALVFVVVAAHGRDETLGAGRDQQIYAEFAMALADRGAPDVSYRTTSAADQALLRGTRDRRACHATLVDRYRASRLSSTPFVVAGGVNACDGIDDPIVLLHPWGWPAWLALGYGAFGIEGLYRLNAAIYALAGLVFFALARQYVASRAAAVAAIVLYALPSSLWIGGLSLSEPLAMTLVLALPLLAPTAMRKNSALFAAVLASAILVRIDSASLAPLAIGCALVATLVDARAKPAAVALGGEAFGALLAASLVDAVLVPSYVDAVWPFVIAVIVASALLFGVLVAVPASVGRRVGRVLRDRNFRATMIVGLVALSAYAALLRPRFAPDVSGHAPHAFYDFREYSLVNLAAMLSWPLLVAALVGVTLAVRDGWLTRRDPGRQLVLVTATATAITLLAFPAVSPDQPWGFRRFLPVVVPYAVLFAAVAAERALAARRRGARALALAASLVVLVAVALLPRGAALLRENDGSTATLAAMARALPDDVTVASADERDVAAALLVGYGKPVAPYGGLDTTMPADDALVTWVRDRIAAGRSPWFMHDPGFDDAGLDVGEVSRFELRRQFVRPALKAPATDVVSGRRTVVLSRIDAIAAPQSLRRMFGAEPAWGSAEHGFHATEVASFGTFRYTTGDAWIDVPAAALAGADALKVDVVTYGKFPRETAVRIGGRVAWQGRLDPGISTLRVPLAARPGEPVTRIGIRSERVDPSALGADDPRRDIGVGLIGVRTLVAGEPHESGADMRDFRASLAFVGELVEPVIATDPDATLVLHIGNAGAAYWPSYREHPDPVGVVKLALRWTRRDAPDAPVADNRWPLAVSMLSGDRMRIRVPLQPAAPDGTRLPAGDYDVQISMVREGFARFAEPVTVVVRVPR